MSIYNDSVDSDDYRWLALLVTLIAAEWWCIPINLLHLGSKLWPSKTASCLRSQRS